MALKKIPTPYFNWNPIALWLLIHGGDPPPDRYTAQIVSGILVQRAAAGIADKALAAQISELGAKAVAQAAQRAR
jgi:hypothetical protein